MRNHNAAVWPVGKTTSVEIIENGGAWFVLYEKDDGTRDYIRKGVGRPKGFRSIDWLVRKLRFACGVMQISVTAELPMGRHYRESQAGRGNATKTSIWRFR